ncbi:hypothetical protein JAAARDRAFT_34303 [Jaapia argillacea MUCL 33604]|uniref:Uncharacterized protein n=1 Tax=Jaapia argillacea MUCL 33604 TaxID=933084 RepID=A0A067PX97_9AGAM|nr:hypothetical protein JAAARDRAFT_34303 [Jaapia argillacea MUCL 33604]
MTLRPRSPSIPDHQLLNDVPRRFGIASHTTQWSRDPDHRRSLRPPGDDGQPRRGTQAPVGGLKAYPEIQDRSRSVRFCCAGGSIVLLVSAGLTLSGALAVSTAAVGRY